MVHYFILGILVNLRIAKCVFHHFFAFQLDREERDKPLLWETYLLTLI